MPYCDYWYEDLPESGKKAATILGYTQETWDNDEDSPYDTKDFKDCSLAEKSAALFLGMDPLESEKLDVWWEELDEETKKHAQALKWTQKLWDDDYDLADLESDHWYWKDMTDEQKEAARHFGYLQPTWDETGEDVDFENIKIPSGSKKNAKKRDEKKAGESKKPDNSKQKTDTQDSKKKNFSVSRFFGGEEGTLFDQRNHRWIESIEVFGGSIVSGLKVTYCNHVVEKAGSTDGGKSHKFELAAGEYVNKVEIRAEKVVQELTFHTNTGKTHGPFGGHGRLLKDKKGEVHEIQAPPNSALCGIVGRQTSNKHIDAIALRWGPASDHLTRK